MDLKMSLSAILVLVFVIFVLASLVIAFLKGDWKTILALIFIFGILGAVYVRFMASL